ncbi:hypothetical protein BDZ91DRAFT_834200, partial [Kalaharituber pfeilii]
PVPSVVFFHGGSLISGNREFLCKDIKRDALSRGWGFISADYRLLIPSTGHEILRDVKSLFAFLADTEGGLNKELRALGCPHQIDPNRLFVGGSSAGAYPAFLAALFAQPKPKGFFSLYGVGGDFLTEFYLPWLLPSADSLDGLIYSLLTFKFSNSCRPGLLLTNRHYRSNPWNQHPRPPGSNWGALRAALHHSGKFLDYLTGMEGLGSQLSNVPDYKARCEMVASCEKCKYLFPQIWIDKDFPPVSSSTEMQIGSSAFVRARLL